MANVSRNPREHWLKTHFLKNEVANSGYTTYLAYAAFMLCFRACGAVLLLNVANVVMLPFANVANCQFITPPSLGTEN